MPESTPTFALTMTYDQALLAAPILAQIGIVFQPADCMIEHDPDDDSYWIMSSSELDHLMAAIRDRLDEFHPGCHLPEPNSLEVCHQALRLAYWEFEWAKHRPSGDLWTESGGTWDQVRDRYPALFATA